MTKGILGRKIGMTQLFSETGELVPVTVIQAEPNVVLQKRTLENDGYEALQIGFADEKESRTNKAKKVMLLKLKQPLSAAFVNSVTLILTTMKLVRK